MENLEVNMKNSANTDNIIEFGSKNSTFNETKEEPLQKIEQAVTEVIQPTKISAETGGNVPSNDPELKRVILHTANALAMGGVGTLFHHIGAPPEVIITIIFIDLIYIMRFLINSKI